MALFDFIVLYQSSSVTHSLHDPSAALSRHFYRPGDGALSLPHGAQGGVNSVAGGVLSMRPQLGAALPGDGEDVCWKSRGEDGKRRWGRSFPLRRLNQGA